MLASNKVLNNTNISRTNINIVLIINPLKNLQNVQRKKSKIRKEKKIFFQRTKKFILLGLLFKEISLQQELYSPPCFRLHWGSHEHYGGGGGAIVVGGRYFRFLISKQID